VSQNVQNLSHNVAYVSGWGLSFTQIPKPLASWAHGRHSVFEKTTAAEGMWFVWKTFQLVAYALSGTRVGKVILKQL